MILNVSDLIKKKVYELNFHLEFDVKKLQRDDFVVELADKLKVKGTATLDGEDILLKGTIETKIKSFCSRCLAPVDYPLMIDFEEKYSKKQGEDIYMITEDRINLEEMIIDDVILSYPAKILCSDDCKGLCPVCGKNLNEGQCECLKDIIDPRLEALKQFFKGD